MRLIACLVALVALAGCQSARITPPTVKVTPGKVETTPTPCEKKPVYVAPAPHIDTGPDVCRPGDPACDPHAHDHAALPGYELSPEIQAANEANSTTPDASPCDSKPKPKPSGPPVALGVLVLLSVASLGLVLR